MDSIAEYEDALVTMQLAVAQERLEKGQKAKPNLRLRNCINMMACRLKEQKVLLVCKGIARQAQPVAALTKTVREYQAIRRELQEKGHVILKFKS